jgi:hypothetical protein
MSQLSWVVAGIVPGIEREPLKKLAPDEGASTGAPRQTGSIPSYLNVLFSAGCAGSGITARWW